MYNRYIPQPDGTFRRSQRQDTPSRQQKQQPMHQHSNPPKELPRSQEHSAATGENPHTEQLRKRPVSPAIPPPGTDTCRECHGASVGGFLKNLLPKDFDTGDLLIVLLLLLMAGDCPDEQNTALLTLVLYLFL